MAEKLTGNLEPHLEGEGTEASENAFSDKQLSEINTMVSKAIGSRLRAVKDEFSQNFSEFRNLLTDRLPQKEAGKDEEKPQKAQKESDSEKALRQKIERLEQREAKARDTNLELKAHELLQRHQVNPKLAKPLVAMWKSDGTLKYADADSDLILMKYGDQVYDSLDEGIGAFVSSEDAKPYLPAKGVNGAGESRYQASRSRNPQPNQLHSKEQAGDALFGLIGGGMSEE